jgi:hypothetical protein
MSDDARRRRTDLFARRYDRLLLGDEQISSSSDSDA